MEKKVVLVICDLCMRSERPATHRVTIDVCNRHTIRDEVGGQHDDRPPNGSSPEQRERDNEDLLNLVLQHPGNTMRWWSEEMEWDSKRTSATYKRLHDRGLLMTKGRTSNARWFATAKATKEASIGS